MTFEEIKKLSYKEKDEMQNMLWKFIEENDLTQIKKFLHNFNVQYAFCSPSFDDKEEPIFNAAITLRNACFTWEKTKNFEMLEFLLQYGLKVNDNDGWGNALQYYAYAGGQDSQIISFLLENGAGFEDYGKDGWNFLHRCADKQDIQKLKLALKYGANINTRTEIRIGKAYIKQTPLMILVLCELPPNAQAIKALIELGADVNATDKQKSVLDMALNAKYKEILQQFGAKSYEELNSLPN